MLRRIWPDAVVEESNLAQNVFTLRKALGDTPEGARFIATVPRRGYRFVAPVTLASERRVAGRARRGRRPPPLRARGSGAARRSWPPACVMASSACPLAGYRAGRRAARRQRERAQALAPHLPPRASSEAPASRPTAAPSSTARPGTAGPASSS